ncbi:MAG TPA: methylglyoxal synthase [Actinomycetota bacterium]|jgi:methylglyoxal synthase|nr:methylglyoxal synthase [Actinomycetota bacterium]
MKIQPVVMPAVKTIALVAHDNRKSEMVDWANWNRPILSQHLLCATGTTGALLENEVGLDVTRFRSGPLGGDQQIGAGITEGHIDFVVFFWDPLESHSHDVDVKALLRIAAVYNIPIACNRSSADFMVTSPLMAGEYVRLAFDYDSVVSPAEEAAARL